MWDGSGGPGRREPQVVSAYILIQAEVEAARVAKEVGGIKVPSPFPSRTETLRSPNRP
jgi:hypothetical protein